MANKDEKLKTRPDLDDEHYLAYLSNQPENRGINVYALYKAMLDWCWKKGKTPSRRRLLTWLDTERENIPMTAMPVRTPQPGKSTDTGDTPSANPNCKKCKGSGSVQVEDKAAKFDWARFTWEPCPSCCNKEKKMNIDAKNI